MASYSPYSKTKITTEGTLGILAIRPVPAYSEDPLYTVEPQYTHRPDLLAYDMYGDKNLWWIFAQRNLDVIEDPVYDLVPGLQIYLPDPSRVKEHLGE
tara:strand:- start:298 stop:591 length:294 start_codon:yes stop_codon:yes gene_type:complete